MKIRLKPLRIILTICALPMLAALFFAAIQLYVVKFSETYYVTPDTAPVSDAVMVLGALVYGDGTPSPVLQDRLLFAYELYRAGRAKKILVSGDHGARDYDEVNAMKNFLIAKGVPGEDIFMDHAGFNTYDSMYRAKEIFGVRTLLVSTQEFHMGRALYIARKLGMDAYGYASPDRYVYSITRLRQRESLARIKAFIDVELLRRKPKFGGDLIPISGDGSMTDG